MKVSTFLTNALARINAIASNRYIYLQGCTVYIHIVSQETSPYETHSLNVLKIQGYIRHIVARLHIVHSIENVSTF